MKNHNQLLEEYEDALFALLMEPVAEHEGKAAMEENERLKNDPTAAVPEEITRNGLRTIRREFAKKRRQHMLKTAGRVFSNVAVFLLVSTLCFATAYAAMPEVRIQTLNFLIEVSDVATNITLIDSSSASSTQNSPHSTGVRTGPGSALAEDGTLGGYQMPELSDDYEISLEERSSRGLYVRYCAGEEIILTFRVDKLRTSGINIDTEDAPVVEYVTVNGYDGIYVEKDDSLHLVWGDTDHGYIINILATGITREDIFSYAEIMKYING